MQTRKLVVRVEAEESVAAVYARDLQELPDALLLRVGTLQLVGRPAHMVQMLGEALEQCWAAWSSGYQDDARDGHGDATDAPSKITFLPPLVENAVVDDTLSRVGPWPTAQPHALDDGAAITDPLVSSGGGIKTSFYLIRSEAKRDG